MERTSRNKKAKLELTEAAQEARRAYKREWARRNPDKIKASQVRYWERKAAQAMPEGESQ